ncbi:MAG: DTW domain-containing protein [Rhodospirillaceae bacterium]|nr:MAG: DTW domain-containing protein [Rhodospirillaceae bacterium]
MTTTAAPSAPVCPRCHKVPPLCVCTGIVPLDNRIGVLIIQHPQEQDVDLGTAHLTALHFRNAAVRVGLSWPSLAKALGRPADPKHWGTLYLGSVKPASLLPGQDVIALTRKGAAHPDQRGQLAGLEGVILLDGTWSQAKALWWRNPWLIKTTRIVLGPHRPSRYGKLRREARREAISTLEATALLLSKLENRPEIADALHAGFDKLLDRYREREKATRTSVG